MKECSEDAEKGKKVSSSEEIAQISDQTTRDCIKIIEDNSAGVVENWVFQTAEKQGTSC